MHNLYIIESPFQLLNAFEAINTFNAESNKILVRLSNESNNDKQIIDTIRKLKIEESNKIFYVKIKSRNRFLFDFLKMIILKIIFLFIRKRYNKIFIGNYDSRFIRFILKFSKKQLVLLDDGFKTIITQSKFTKNHFYNWFTILNLKALSKQVNVKNNYSTLNSLLDQNNDTTPKVSIFIGSKLNEVNIISEEYYIELIKRIAHKHNDYKIIYIPHRGEDQEKLVKIASIPNIELKKISYPIELLPIYENIKPVLIISFYSTALITLWNIYKVDTIAYRFNYKKSTAANDINKVYDYCSNYINVLEEPKQL